jgi:hypothetical protein
VAVHLASVGGLVLVVNRRRRADPVEEADIARQREAVRTDLEGVAWQRETGEIDLDTADRLTDLYRSELQPPPLPRCADSLRALARYRGAAIGVEYAEAFMLMREIA